MRSDLLHRADICRLDEYFRGQADHILAQDILEHIPYSDNNREQWRTTLHSWVECLKPGGTIRIQVPSPEGIFARFYPPLSGRVGPEPMSEYDLNRVIYGESTNAWDKHYQLFTLDRLTKVLEEEGLTIESAEILNVCAIVVGRKP